MKIMRSLVIGGAVMLSIGIAAPTYASHEHYIDTPGTCVTDVASGQTSKGPSEGGYHRFHKNVHLGQPGTEAFANPNNPVGVGKGSSCPE